MGPIEWVLILVAVIAVVSVVVGVLPLKGSKRNDDPGKDPRE